MTLRVLIVDDDFVFTDLLPRLLRREVGEGSLEITTAGSPEDALRLLAERPFDVLVSDYDLKAALTGYDVLRAAGGVAPAPFRVLISGHAHHELAAGEGLYDVFIPKPMTLREMVPALLAPLRERFAVPSAA